MISILTTTDKVSKLKSIIDSIDRLNELVVFSTDKNEVSTILKILYVESNTIKKPLDWHDEEPPYVFPDITYSDNNFLALVFFTLGNHQKAFEFVTEQDELYRHLLIATNLVYGYLINNTEIDFLENTSAHNFAIVYNFGKLDRSIENATIQNAYKKALGNADNSSIKLFSAKHYANLLMDGGMYADAEKLVRTVSSIASLEQEKNTISYLLASVLKAQLALPYQENELSEIRALQKECILYYENKQLKINAGLLLIDASEIASLQQDFRAAKEHITKAILYFKDEDIPEFLGEATLQKATILYNWSKNGSPQYYKPAINTFQNALKVFKRDSHPQKFADIHHSLALIYSEIKVSENEKPIWTAFCASSFKEALAFYTKEQFAYQYAMIAHNYATALMGFPQAKLHNNLDKSFGLFEESLAIRTAKKHPVERALTLLNQLELAWLIHNKTQQEEVSNYEDMQQKAQEILVLVTDDILIKRANEHLSALEKLKTLIN